MSHADDLAHQSLPGSAAFEPFRILVADGREYDVLSSESIALTGKGRLIAVGMDDYFVTLDLLLVTGIVRPIPRKQGRVRRSA